MKLSQYLLLLLFSIYSYSQSPIKYWIDSNGKAIEKEKFLLDWREKDEYSRWDYKTIDSSRVAKLSNNKYILLKLNHKTLVAKINLLTNKSLSDSTTFIIEFKFKDDYCIEDLSNNFTKGKIYERKIFTDELKKKLEQNKNIIYLCFFENGIKLKNSISNNEYFFLDSEDFLRQNIFIKPALCGSFLISKPNGETLVRNGEFSSDNILEFLIPNNWKLMFN